MRFWPEQMLLSKRLNDIRILFHLLLMTSLFVADINSVAKAEMHFEYILSILICLVDAFQSNSVKLRLRMLI